MTSPAALTVMVGRVKSSESSSTRPSPPPALIAQKKSATATAISAGADRASTHLIDSVPNQTMTICSSQKSRKQASSPPLMPRKEPVRPGHQPAMAGYITLPSS